MLCTISVRGDVVPACIAAHMLIPSTFTGPVPAMLLSGSCAIFATVGYQSTMLCRVLHRQQPHSPMLRATATRGRGKLRGKNRMQLTDAAYCIMPSQLVPFTASFSSGELTIATPRTPPCHSVHFDPLGITISNVRRLLSQKRFARRVAPRL
jgi:hypothetical protein